MIALAIFASLQIADAQVKSASAAKSAVEKAVVDAGNPKKAAKVATWINVAKAYKDAYDSPMGNAIRQPQEGCEGGYLDQCGQGLQGCL